MTQQSPYMQAWLRDDTLEKLNRRIHDGVPGDQLLARAHAYTQCLFELFFPYSQPGAESKVMEFGSGVGWIIESVQQKYGVKDITGLDISPNMIERAQERLGKDNPATFTLYDGLNIPYADDMFDNIYSVACLQHIEKSHAFLLFKEMQRVLKPTGYVTFQVLSVHHIIDCPIPYETECLNQINQVDAHYHYYYSFDELFVIFHKILKVKNLDIQHNESGFWVSFSKTGKDFINEQLPQLTYPSRLSGGV